MLFLVTPMWYILFLCQNGHLVGFLFIFIFCSSVIPCLIKQRWHNQQCSNVPMQWFSSTLQYNLVNNFRQDLDLKIVLSIYTWFLDFSLKFYSDVFNFFLSLRCKKMIVSYVSVISCVSSLSVTVVSRRPQEPNISIYIAFSELFWLVYIICFL